jgi:hypothetical protein
MFDNSCGRFLRDPSYPLMTNLLDEQEAGCYGGLSCPGMDMGGISIRNKMR